MSRGIVDPLPGHRLSPIRFGWITLMAAVLAVTGLSLRPGTAGAQDAGETPVTEVPLTEPTTEVPVTEVSVTEPPTEVPIASISLDKTVYPGVNGGASCPTAANFAEAGQNDPVTYCFMVTNTGETYLASIVVIDPDVASQVKLATADSIPLAPGHSARYFVEAVPPADDADGSVDDTFINRASVSAVAVGHDGTPIEGSEQPMATAEAVVYPPEVVPAASLSLAMSVYAGTDGGAGCPAADVTTVAGGDPVTYCFAVTNTGNTLLDAISFADLGVSGTPAQLSVGPMPLAPGATALYYLDATAPALPAQGYLSTAVASANAVDETGADLTGLSDASGSDETQIQAMVAGGSQVDSSSHRAAVESTTAAPQQLAFTGWETWLLATGGIGLMAAGWLLATSSQKTPAAIRASITPSRRPGSSQETPGSPTRSR